MKAFLLFVFIVAVLAAGRLMFNKNDWGKPME